MEYKFNIWDSKEKKWHKDVLCDIGEHDNFLDDVSCWDVCYDAKSESDKKRFLWEQYIGIKDSEGKEIYSSFIIEFNHGGKRTVAEVTYEAPAFCLRIIESHFYTKGVVILWDQLFFKNPKIIGNIYEGYTK